eukprot:12419800-Ditylum_brightwellii.AAC.1
MGNKGNKSGCNQAHRRQSCQKARSNDLAVAYNLPLNVSESMSVENFVGLVEQGSVQGHTPHSNQSNTIASASTSPSNASLLTNTQLKSLISKMYKGSTAFQKPYEQLGKQRKAELKSVFCMVLDEVCQAISSKMDRAMVQLFVQ